MPVIRSLDEAEAGARLPELADLGHDAATIGAFVDLVTPDEWANIEP